MFNVKNRKNYYDFKYSDNKNYLFVTSSKEELLVIPQNIYSRAMYRQKKFIRNPEVLAVDGVPLILTKNEWKKIQKHTANHNFVKLYRHEQRDRFHMLNVSQKYRNIHFLNKANAAGVLKKEFDSLSSSN